jgi:hypothetical protein
MSRISQTYLVDMTIWMDNWQLDCCGEPFSVGSQVSWTVWQGGHSWLAALLGPGASVTLDAVEDHHGKIPKGAVPTVGTVTSIAAAYCRYAPRTGSGLTRYRVEGSGVLTPLQRADKFRPRRGDLEFMGYLVQLDVTGTGTTSR